MRWLCGSASLALAGTCLVAFGSAQAADISAHLSASPTAFSGKCPAVITFSGRITSRKRAEVRYKFLRSDGALAPEQTLVFTGPGTKTVSTTWTLGDVKLLPSYAGWEAIEILSPAPVVKSNQAHFKIQCK